ncbi:AraC-like DNA-binding protein [Streptomyces sp. MAA16]|nr:AraC-like DNA-binding protein [Streptomyces sp. MAA16]
MAEMLVETVFRSADLPTAERFEGWRQVMSATHAPLELRSTRAADFHARLRLIGLGDVAVWPAEFDPTVFVRTPKLIRQSDPEIFHLTLVLKGHGGVAWSRQEATYGLGDFYSTDSARTSETWTSQELIRTVGVEVPKARLPLPRGRAEQAIGRPMSGGTGVGALLALFLTQLSENTGQYTAEDAPRLGTVLADLVAALFAHTLETVTSLSPETRRRTLALAIQAFIRQNLHDPGLTPGAIAAAHSVSLSHLHRLFRDEGVTVAAYIRGQRLEGARHNLTDPALHDTPIHVIAARWGFPRAAEFSRAFRAAYGVPPRDYRHGPSRTAA